MSWNDDRSMISVLEREGEGWTVQTSKLWTWVETSDSNVLTQMFWLKCSDSNVLNSFKPPNPIAALEQRSSYWEFLNESRVSIHLKGANDCKGLQWLDRSFARSSCGLYCTLCKRCIAILVLLCDSLIRIQHLVTMPQEASLFWWAEIGAWCSHFGTSTEIWR